VNAPAPGNAAAQRGVLFGLVGGVLALLLVSYLGDPAPKVAEPAPVTRSPIDHWEAASHLQPVPDDEEERRVAPRKQEPAAAPAAPPPPEQPTSASFSFLGKVEEQGRAVVVLQGAGRTLKVQGTGAIDSDYVIDAVQDGYVIVRHARLGTSQLVELTAPRRTLDPAWSAEDSQQD
jgi:hypothetical protein